MTGWLLTWFWQGTVLAVGVAVALRCASRQNAATRHLIWCAALAAVAWLGAASSPHRAPNAVRSSVADVIYIPSAPDFLISIIVGIWAAVALVMLLRVLPALRGVYAVRARCRPIPWSIESRLPLWLEAKTCGRRTGLMICDEAPGATVLGFLRPCIAMPSSLVRALTIDELDQVILHEHAHVQRRDDWARLVQTLLLSVLWIHPAALFMSRALNREREMACDEWVVARTGLPKAYARCLAHAAEARLRMRGGPTLVPALIGSRQDLLRRVDRVLTMDGKARRRVSIAGATAAACAIVVVSVQLRSVRLEEIADIALPHVSRPTMTIFSAPATVQVFAAGRPARASSGESRISLGKSGKRDTAYGVPVESAAFAPQAQIASADEPIAPVAPNAPDTANLPARVLTGAYSSPKAPVETSTNPSSPWRTIAASGVDIAASAKKTSVGVGSALGRAGVSLARSF
jgi:beta-lactamase regulating signal transducer with metallopeptidase domain